MRNDENVSIVLGGYLLISDDKGDDKRGMLSEGES